MLSRYAHQGLTWIDLESPTREEAVALGEEFSLHPLVVNELIADTERAKVDVYANAIYLALHFPIKNRSTGHIEEAEVDFVLLGDTLITVHYDLIDPLHDFARMFEAGSYLDGAQKGTHAGMLFFLQMRELYKHSFFILASVEGMIREIEKDIFKGSEAGMVARLSRAASALIDIRGAMRSHKETLKSLNGVTARLYGQEFSDFMNVIEGECMHLDLALEENRQMLQDMRRTNDSLLSAKTNAIIRQLTVISVVVMPLNLIAFIFAMHSQYLYLDQAWQLGAVLVGMAAIGLVTLLYFRSKKWL
jgi:magnesium transporter